MLKNKSILKFVAVLTVMIMSIGMLTGCEMKSLKEKESNVKNATSQGAYEEPVKNLVEGLGEGNAEKFLNAFPDFITSYMKDIFTDEYLQETLKDAEEDYGANIKMSYKVTKTTELSGDDLKSMQEDVKTNYGEEVNITKGYKLDVEITTKGDKSEDVDTDSFKVYEINEKWCIVDF